MRVTVQTFNLSLVLSFVLHNQISSLIYPSYQTSILTERGMLVKNRLTDITEVQREPLCNDTMINAVSSRVPNPGLNISGRDSED
jgi:hypothetical protein